MWLMFRSFSGQQQQQQQQLRWCVIKRCFSASSHPPSRTAASAVVVVVALSGGVDSAVAAALLKKEQQQQQQQSSSVDSAKSAMNLVGIHMSNWNSASHDDDSLTACSSEADWQDALRTAQHLDVPVTRVTQFESDYWCHVFEPYVRVLADTGATGNPDVACNTRVKFGALLQHCQRTYGPDTKLATGHYARLWHRNARARGRNSWRGDCDDDEKQSDI